MLLTKPARRKNIMIRNDTFLAESIEKRLPDAIGNLLRLKELLEQSKNIRIRKKRAVVQAALMYYIFDCDTTLIDLPFPAYP